MSKMFLNPTTSLPSTAATWKEPLPVALTTIPASPSRRGSLVVSCYPETQPLRPSTTQAGQPCSAQGSQSTQGECQVPGWPVSPICPLTPSPTSHPPLAPHQTLWFHSFSDTPGTFPPQGLRRGHSLRRERSSRRCPASMTHFLSCFNFAFTSHPFQKLCPVRTI